jgi:hypothetical protein
MLTSQNYTAIFAAAAGRHEKPVDPVSLLDTRRSFDDNCLRARINAVICYHLHHNKKEPIHRIARVYSLTWETIYSRIRTGRKLVKKSPWNQTYKALP